MKLAILLIFILLTKFLDSKKRNAKQIENTEERITTRQSTSQFSKSSKQVFFKFVFCKIIILIHLYFFMRLKLFLQTACKICSLARMRDFGGSSARN